MIGLRSRDSAFFTVTCLDGAIAVRPEDVVSLTVVEEMDKACTGTLRLHDPTFSYSRVLRNFRTLGISWGYTAQGLPESLEDLRDVIAGGMQRRGLRAIIQSPSGSGEGGTHFYNCNFIDIETMNYDKSFVYSQGTKGSVVLEVMARLGVVAPEINFKLMTQPLTPDTTVRQCESDFRFLVRMAKEWRCFFRIGNTAVGLRAGCFIDPDKIPVARTVKVLTGSITGLTTLNYNAGEKSNVISYSWQNHEGEGGVGDGVRLEYVNGVATFLRYTIENEKVRTWRLNMERAQEYVNAGDIAQSAAYMAEVVGAMDFNNRLIKALFDPVDTSTAPNGVGYTVTAQCLGTPFAAPPSIIEFGEGFPDRLRYPAELMPMDELVGPLSALTAGAVTQGRQNVFYLRRASHTVTREGYHTELEIVDVYTLSPTGMIL